MTLYRKLAKTLQKIAATEVTVYAANASFFILLSLFPAMMLLIGLLQYMPLTPDDLQNAMTGFIPMALEPLLDYMTQELFSINSVALLSVSAVVALWASSKGVHSLLRGLNRVYHVKETRNYFLVRLRCTFYTILLLAALILSLVLHLLGQRALVWLENARLHFLVYLLRMKYLLLIVLLTGLFSMIFSVFPNRKLRFLDALPGAAAAAVSWLLFSKIFSFYATRFGNFSLYYGSLAVIALAMTWLYFCMSILFYAGMLNYYLEQHRSQK